MILFLHHFSDSTSLKYIRLYFIKTFITEQTAQKFVSEIPTKQENPETNAKNTTYYSSIQWLWQHE